jgi:hypothetical protein
MKKILINCLSMLLLISQALHAQYIPEYDSALRFHVLSKTFEAAVSTHQQVVNSDTGEGGEANAFRRWVEWADNRRSLGAAEGEDIFWPYSMESMSYIENPGFYCIGSSTATPNWKCVGPYVNYYYSNSTSVEYAGRVDFVWCDEDDQAHILASANTGGLWETHDTGHKWKCITDNATIGVGNTKIPGTVGITYLAVNPQNNNNIFLQLGVSGSTGVSYGYNMGLMFTENGGASWQLDTFYRHILGAGPTAGLQKAPAPTTNSRELLGLARSDHHGSATCRFRFHGCGSGERC